MPANPKKISFASASTDTMLKWLRTQGTVSVGSSPKGWSVSFWRTGSALIDGEDVESSSHIVALRKLCRAVQKGTHDA